MTQRQDARRNRERLLLAAEQVFRDDGVNVPLQLVAERAHVGHGTLYRHFPDRDQLVRAVVEHRLEQIEARLAGAPDPAHSVQDIFSVIADTLSVIAEPIQYLASTDQGQAALSELAERLRGVLAQPMDAARAQGLLRPGVTFDDFLASWAMIEGSMLTVPTGERQRMAERAKALLGVALFEPSP